MHALVSVQVSEGCTVDVVNHVRVLPLCSHGRSPSRPLPQGGLGGALGDLVTLLLLPAHLATLSSAATSAAASGNSSLQWSSTAATVHRAGEMSGEHPTASASS